MSDVIDYNALIVNKDMDAALSEAAEKKHEIMTSCKSRLKDSQGQFFEIMLDCRDDIQEILSKKRKHRTSQEEDQLKLFKKTTSRQFKLAADYIIKEDLAEGEPSKLDKLADKIADVVQLLRYIGHSELEDKLKERGIALSYSSLEEAYPKFKNDSLKDNVRSLVENASSIKKSVKDDTEEIKDGIYLKIPVDLQYDKEANPRGIKTSDWSKLVDFQAKLMATSSVDETDQVKDKISDAAGEKEFESARAKLVQFKMIEMAKDETEKEKVDG